MPYGRDYTLQDGQLFGEIMDLVRKMEFHSEVVIALPWAQVTMMISLSTIILFCSLLCFMSVLLCCMCCFMAKTKHNLQRTQEQLVQQHLLTAGLQEQNALLQDRNTELQQRINDLEILSTVQPLGNDMKTLSGKTLKTRLLATVPPVAMSMFILFCIMP